MQAGHWNDDDDDNKNEIHNRHLVVGGSGVVLLSSVAGHHAGGGVLCKQLLLQHGTHRNAASEAAPGTQLEVSMRAATSAIGSMTTPTA